MTVSSQSKPIQSYIVKGMTCSHCVTSVREEVSDVPGVEAVEVSLNEGLLKVAGESVSDEAVHAAVEAAGYTVVGS